MPCRPVGRAVAEDRRLPTSEGVGGHRHRDGHVDSDHADLDGPLELPGRGAVAGEHADAVAVRVGIDQVDGFQAKVATSRRTPRHGAEICLVVGAAGLSTPPMKQRAAEEEARPQGKDPAVHHDRPRPPEAGWRKQYAPCTRSRWRR